MKKCFIAMLIACTSLICITGCLGETENASKGNLVESYVESISTGNSLENIASEDNNSVDDSSTEDSSNDASSAKEEGTWTSDVEPLPVEG